MPVPASIIMNVNDAVRSGLQTGLHESIVFTESSSVKDPAELAVDKILPCHWQPEDVELVFGDKVVHLARPVCAAVYVGI